MPRLLGRSSLPRYQWVLRETDPLAAESRSLELSRSLGCHPIVARVLIARGLDEPDKARAFLNPTESDILPPDSVPGIEQARDRLVEAVKKSEQVLIHGDYDADGIVGAVILHRTLKELGCSSRIFLPERTVHGFGLAPQAIEKARAAGIGLMVTVDCGISSSATVAAAQEAGIEVIVTDHHALPDRLPSDAILVHPDLDGEYPGGKIAGATVAYKLCLALLEVLGGDVEGARERYLPLVALATVADVCPLTGENRALTALGLKDIPKSTLPGLRALWRGTRREGDGGTITARDVAFGLAPILNAAGRMGDPFPAAKLLLSKDENAAWKSFRALDHLNRERRRAQQEICRRLRMLPEVAWEGPEAGLLVVADEQCTPGLAGLAAARMSEETGRPTCILAPSEDEDGPLYRGSMRTAGGENLLEIMAPAKAFAERLGGHPGALGLTVRPDRLEEFMAACREIAWTPRPAELLLDFPIEEAPDDPETVLALDATRPWGEGNPRPAFVWGPVTVKGTRAVGKSGDHLQVTLHGKGGTMLKGIGFSMSRYLPGDSGIGRRVHAAGHFTVNNWQGMESVEFQFEDLDFSAS